MKKNPTNTSNFQPVRHDDTPLLRDPSNRRTPVARVTPPFFYHNLHYLDIQAKNQRAKRRQRLDEIRATRSLVSQVTTTSLPNQEPLPEDSVATSSITKEQAKVLRNRASARLSRVRLKEKVANLEKQVLSLQAMVAERDAIIALNTENFFLDADPYDSLQQSFLSPGK